MALDLFAKELKRFSHELHSKTNGPVLLFRLYSYALKLFLVVCCYE